MPQAGLLSNWFRFSSLTLKYGKHCVWSFIWWQWRLTGERREYKYLIVLLNSTIVNSRSVSISKRVIKAQYSLGQYRRAEKVLNWMPKMKCYEREQVKTGSRTNILGLGKARIFLFIFFLILPLLIMFHLNISHDVWNQCQKEHWYTVYNMNLSKY